MLDTIKDMLERDPFHPFRIILTNGDRYDVTNPHLVAFGDTMIFYAFPRSDRLAYLRLNQIAAIETTPAAA